MLHLQVAYLGNIDLNGGMILGMDNTVGGRALPGHKQVNVFSNVVLHGGGFGGALQRKKKRSVV